MTTGKLLRQAHTHNADGVCPNCGHTTAGHRELARNHTDYKPLAFHCSECDCVVQK